MNPSQLAVTTKCYCNFPLERALAGIASCEITGVELCASVGWYGPSGISGHQKYVETDENDT